MNIRLSEQSRRFVADQVARGRYPSEDAVLEDALARMRRHEPNHEAAKAADEDPILGMFRDDADLIDEVVDEAMKIREERPWRLPAGE
jgi:putative addiction module CopG family antidote